VARPAPAALVLDVGSTTTDVTLVRGGRVAAIGRTDPERLVAGELVYTGAVRTNVAAIVPHVPLWGRQCPVASEYFAQSGDVHVLLGDLDPAAYTAPTPDGRAPTEPVPRQNPVRRTSVPIPDVGGLPHRYARRAA